MSRIGDAVHQYRERTPLPITAQAGMLVVAGAAAVTSFDGLRGLAVRCGTPEGIAFLLPVSIDAAAAVATVVWLTYALPAVAAEARNLAWTAIGLSVVGNAVEHALAVLRVAVDPTVMIVVAVVVGGVPPAIYGAIVHLGVAATRPPEPALPRPMFSVQDVPQFEVRLSHPDLGAPAGVPNGTPAPQGGAVPHHPPGPDLGPPTGPIAPPPTQLHPVPDKRTRKELEADAARQDLRDEEGRPLKRREGESVASLRERVEAAETQARRARRAGT